MSRTTSLLLRMLVFPTLLSLQALAQTTEQGLKPFGSYDTNDLDSINLVNGGLLLRAPLVSYPQRGDRLNLSFFIRYNSGGWRVVYTTTATGTTGKWTWFGTGAEVVRDQIIRVNCHSVTITFFGGGVNKKGCDARTSDGSVHQLADTTSTGTSKESIDAQGSV